MRELNAVIAVVMLSGCFTPEPVAVSREALRGGSSDAGVGLDETYMLRMRFNTGQQYVCTATLITSRTLLTAAHCFDPAAAPAGNTTLVDVYAQNANVAPSSSSSSWIRIDPARTRLHPMWNQSDRLSYDIAAALLPAASAVTPTPHLARALTSGDVGSPLIVSGFGITGAGLTDFGTRRVATLPLRGLTARHLQLGDMSGTGICNGDSGGPSFLTARDGVRRVAGVHSYDSSLQCNDGLDTRVDLFAASFVQQFIRDEEGGPTCFEDGMCATGCASPDVDCVCLSDGVCSAQCPNLLTDPDCPADCVANGVCATQDCPRPDPDCTAELATCSNASQCQRRVCAIDPQRPNSYCSRSCAETCISGTSCVGGTCLQPQRPSAMPDQSCDPVATFCENATSCTGFTGDPLTCRATCRSDADCVAPGDCIAAQQGAKLCRPTAAPGASCIANLTRCTGATTCSAFVDEPLTCAKPCQRDTDCAMGSSCLAAQFGQRLCAPTATLGEACTPSTRCLGGTVCTGATRSPLTCQPPCTSNTDCALNFSCVDGQRAQRLCVHDPITLTSLGEAQAPAFGCTSVGLSPLIALAILLSTRKFRRR